MVVSKDSQISEESHAAYSSASFTMPSIGGQSSLNQDDSTKKRKKNAGSSSSWQKAGINATRIIFVVALITVAGLLGYAGYRILTDTEHTLARQQFESFTETALIQAKSIQKRQKQGLVTLASVVEQVQPDADSWPHCHVHGFDVIATNEIKTSTGDESLTMALMPIVTPDEKVAFEKYAVNVVGEGDVSVEEMYGFGPNGPYTETDGSTFWDSPNKIFTPFYQHSSKFTSTSAHNTSFLFNWHSLESRGRIVDAMIDCSKIRRQEIVENLADPNYEPRECSALTDIVDYAFKPVIEIPAAISVNPIYPSNNPTEMVAIVTLAVPWENTLQGMFPGGVSGVDCVLQTNTTTFTYEIIDGVASLKGEGDLHDSAFDQYAQKDIVSGAGLYGASSPTYILTIYPNEQLFTVYETNNPTIATIAFVCAIVFTSILFFSYDYFVRSEFKHKDKLSRARRQFVRYISHEVRTPLNACLMGLQLLHDEIKHFSTTTFEECCCEGSIQKVDEQQKLKSRYDEIVELEDDILTSARSAVGVLNDLLNYDKVESGTLSLELEVIPIFDLIQRTFAEFRQPAKLKKLGYELDLNPLVLDGSENTYSSSIDPSELPQYMRRQCAIGDVSRLSQVMRNLISNSLKFTPNGGKLSIRTIWKKSEDSSGAKPSEITLYSGKTSTYTISGVLHIEITDNGAGMTPDQLKNLFKEGVQFDANRLQQGQGSGLGLYISKGMMEQHGGSLIASSPGKGRGTTFTMSLPLYHIEDADDLEMEDDPNSPHTWDLDSLETLRVLVVDDCAVNRKMLSRMLRNHGHECVEAENGKVAVDMVRKTRMNGDDCNDISNNRFNCILMDNEMPVMTGCAAAKRIREMGCDSFIVGVTGTIFKEDVEDFTSSGANVVLPKPLEIQTLLAILVENGVADTTTRSAERPNSIQNR